MKSISLFCFNIQITRKEIPQTNNLMRLTVLWENGMKTRGLRQFKIITLINIMFLTRSKKSNRTENDSLVLLGTLLGIY